MKMPGRGKSGGQLKVTLFLISTKIALGALTLPEEKVIGRTEAHQDNAPLVAISCPKTRGFSDTNTNL
jgi:hypothetical protein